MTPEWIKREKRGVRKKDALKKIQKEKNTRKENFKIKRTKAI